MAQLSIQDTVYALFFPIKVRYAPNLEAIRESAIRLFFNPKDALNRGRFIKSRYEEDSIGIDQGESIDFAERGLAGYRVIDLINKTELRCLFIESLEWFEDYPVKGTQRLKFVYNVFNSYKETLARNTKKELLRLGVPEPTIDTIVPYLRSQDIVDYVSAVCAIILLACLTSMGNKSLQER